MKQHTKRIAIELPVDLANTVVHFCTTNGFKISPFYGKLITLGLEKLQRDGLAFDNVKPAPKPRSQPVPTHAPAPTKPANVAPSRAMTDEELEAEYYDEVLDD